MRDLLIDVFRLVLLFMVALNLGLAVNARRSSPVPIPYMTPEERTQVSLPAFHRDRAATPLTGGPSQPWEIMEPSELRSLLGRSDVVVLDTRPAAQFEQGHIPGAINVPRSHLQEKLPGIFARLVDPKILRVVVYCKGGRCDESRQVATLLSELGIRSIWVLRGGWEEWERTGFLREPNRKRP